MQLPIKPAAPVTIIIFWGIDEQTKIRYLELNSKCLVVGEMFRITLTARYEINIVLKSKIKYDDPEVIHQNTILLQIVRAEKYSRLKILKSEL